jgi:hypothetical protein
MIGGTCGDLPQGGFLWATSLKLKLKLIYDRQSASLSWCQAPIWDPQPIFLSPWNFLQTVVCFLFCSALSDERMGLQFTVQLLLGLPRAVTLGSKSCRTDGHILWSHLRLLQPGEPGPSIYIPLEQGGSVISPGIGFPFFRLLWLAGLWWRYSNPPPHGFRLHKHRLGTNVRVRGFNAGLLTRSLFASGRSWDRPTRSRFSMVFIGPRPNAEVVPKFHIALHASHAALPVLTIKISPCTNVTLTFCWITLFMGDMGEGALHREDEENVKEIKIWLETGTKTNWPTDRRSQCNLKLNLRHCTANYRPVLSSERTPYIKNEESNCHSNKCNIWSPAPKGARHQHELADWTSVVMWVRLRQGQWTQRHYSHRDINSSWLPRLSTLRPPARSGRPSRQRASQR